MKDKIGKLFTRTGEDCWRLVSFVDEPTAVFMNIETKEKSGGVVSAASVKAFVELKPERGLSDSFKPVELSDGDISIDAKKT